MDGVSVVGTIDFITSVGKFVGPSEGCSLGASVGAFVGVPVGAPSTLSMGAEMQKSVCAVKELPPMQPGTSAQDPPGGGASLWKQTKPTSHCKSVGHERKRWSVARVRGR